MSISYTRTKEPVCTKELADELSASLAPTCQYVVINNNDQVTMVFDAELNAADIEEMETILANHVCTDTNPEQPGGGGTEDPTNPDTIRDDLIGGLHQMVFVTEGDAKNKWLSFNGDGSNYSNKTSGVIPWKSRLVGITFTNEKYNVDAHIQCFKASEGVNNGWTNNKIFEWRLTDTRSARKTDITTDIILEAGDRLGIFMSDAGGDPKRVAVILYFQIMDDAASTHSDNYSGYLYTIYDDSDEWDD